ncbi:MAG: WD40/YVTN/BNR-like repeat-containing protein, partial [Flavobacteriales bacterium]
MIRQSLLMMLLSVGIANCLSHSLLSQSTIILEEGLEFRCIGPFRGGRSAAVTGVENDPMTFYMGATGGGVWKTTNGGTTWFNISDGYFGGSIGAVAVSSSHPNILYVG